MKTQVRLLVAFFSITSCSASAVEEVKLEPNAILKFEFPDLPDTYHSQRTGQKQPAMLTAQLPENYSRDGEFPLFLFLGGGSGGLGDRAADFRPVTGPRDYITLNLPLFIKDMNGPATVTPALQAWGVEPNDLERLKGMIMFDDFEVLSASYRVMLQKLLDVVPNISREGSAIGGFSNGAHAVSVLLAGKDEFILSHFESFVIWEGGVALVTNPLVPEDVPVLRKHRFLFLMGDQPDGGAAPERKPRVEALVQGMKKQGVDCTLAVMVGYGHALPKEYIPFLGNWVRREPLPVIMPPVVHTMPQEGLIANVDWKIVRVSSESRFNGKYAKNAIDGDPRTLWHTQWQGGAKSHPHELLIDLGHEHEIRGFRYLARQDVIWNGTLGECEFYVATSPTDFGKPAAHAAFKKARTAQEVTCKRIRGRYILLKTLSAQDDGPWASIAELGVIGE